MALFQKNKNDSPEIYTLEEGTVSIQVFTCSLSIKNIDKHNVKSV